MQALHVILVYSARPSLDLSGCICFCLYSSGQKAAHSGLSTRLWPTFLNFILKIRFYELTLAHDSAAWSAMNGGLES